MPFVSARQRRFAFGTDQPWAEQWAKESKGKRMPECKMKGKGMKKKCNPLKDLEKKYGKRK